MNIGDTVNLKGFTGTTFQEAWIKSKLNPETYNFKILAPKGTKGICASGGSLSTYSETEYLLGHDMKIEILDVDTSTHEVLCIIR